VIVRISGTGQFELDEDAVRRLDELDTRLTAAYEASDEQAFSSALADTVRFVQESGSRVPDNHVVPSEVIIPPDDSTIEDARDYMTNEGLMAPLPA